MSSSWLEEDQQRGTTASVPNGGDGSKSGFCYNHAGSIKLGVRIMNIGTACISAAAAVYGIANIKTGVSALGLFFVGLYMLIFAVILGLYELVQFYPVEKIM